MNGAASMHSTDRHPARTVAIVCVPNQKGNVLVADELPQKHVVFQWDKHLKNTHHETLRGYRQLDR